MKDLRYALIIGVSYNAKNGYICKNSDSESYSADELLEIQKLLKEKLNYKESNIIVLTENTILPTKENIIKYLTSLVIKSVNGELDSIFLYFSGKGDYIRNKRSKKYTVIYPIDYQKNGYITHDNINNILKLIPKNTNFFCIFDCFFPKSILDLKHVYKSENSITTQIKKSPNIESFVVSYCGVKHNKNNNKNTKISLTKIFLDIIKDNCYNITYFDILYEMNRYLDNNNYSVCLVSSLKLDKNDYFCKSNRRTLFWSY